MPSNVIVHTSNGSTHVNASGPAPSTVGLPSGPSAGQARAVLAQPVHPAVGERDVDLDVVGVPVRGDRLDADAGQADLAAVVEDPEAHRIPHLRVVRPLGEHVLAGRVDAAGQVDCHAQLLFMRSTSRVDVVGEQRPDRVEVEAEVLRVRASDAARGSRRSPPTSARIRVLELLGDRLAEPVVEPAHLADRVGLHGAEVDVVEAVVGAAVAELQRPVHARRPVLDVELAEVAAVEVVAEAADDVGVHVGDRQHHVGRVAVGHHEAGVGEDPSR